MQLNELFKGSSVEFEITTNTNTHWGAMYTINDGRRLELECLRHSAPYDAGLYWELIFSVGGTTKKTGEGSEIEVFRTVVAMLEQFKTDQSPDHICMTAAGANRASLYERMLKRGLKGWKIANLPDGGPNDFLLAAIDDNVFPVITTGHLKAAIIVGERDYEFDARGFRGSKSELIALRQQLKDEVNDAEELTDDGSRHDDY